MTSKLCPRFGSAPRVGIARSVRFALTLAIAASGPAFGHRSIAQDGLLHATSLETIGHGTPTSARETPVVQAIRRSSPAVVNIHGQKTVRATSTMSGAAAADSFRQVNGMGTGVVIDPAGYVITNYHVVEDVADILVTLHDGSTVKADLVATRIRSDLALIKVHSPRPLPTIPRGTSSDLMVGETVIAIGNAFGYVHTSTLGIISALHRDVPVNETQDYVDLIQISAGINPGNSGGPLLNIDGEIIGVNVAVRVNAQQIAFAIPIDQVIDTVTEMITEYNDQRMAIGVQVDGGARDGDGVFVTDVVGGSFPEGRELRSGDQVVRVGSRDIDDKLDFALAVLRHPVGEAMEIEAVREGNRWTVAMQAASFNGQTAASIDQRAWDVVGVQVKPASPSAMRQLNKAMGTTYTGGLYITKVRPGSAADKQELTTGDILLGIHQWQTATMKDLDGILQHPDILPGPRAKFFIIRRNQTMFGFMQLAAQRSDDTSTRR